MTNKFFCSLSPSPNFFWEFSIFSLVQWIEQISSDMYRSATVRINKKNNYEMFALFIWLHGTCRHVTWYVDYALTAHLWMYLMYLEKCIFIYVLRCSQIHYTLPMFIHIVWSIIIFIKHFRTRLLLFSQLLVADAKIISFFQRCAVLSHISSNNTWMSLMVNVLSFSIRWLFLYYVPSSLCLP